MRPHRGLHQGFPHNFGVFVTDIETATLQKYSSSARATRIFSPQKKAALSALLVSLVHGVGDMRRTKLSAD